MTFLTDIPHRRYDPLGGNWVLVSPHRLQRPWQGEEADPEAEAPAYDPGCYLCPGNVRAVGSVNPQYEGPWVFDNDYPALLPRAVAPPSDPDPLFRAEPVSGTARVVCYSPDHARGLSRLDDVEISSVISAWQAETADLGRHYPWVQIFENRGAMMGCSNPHPHGQIWASSHIPDIPAREDTNQRDHFARTGRAMLADIADREAEAGERVVVANEEWLAIVPWWATWPFETLVLPTRPAARMTDLDEAQHHGLADALGRLTRLYDRLFHTSCPYSMGWHGAPHVEGNADHWRLHAHFYPPLLRSATVRKHMVGYEMLATPQRDLTPEAAAAMLRAAGERA